MDEPIDQPTSRLSTFIARTLLRDLNQSMRTSPLKKVATWTGITAVFGIVALAIGFAAGIFKLEMLDIQRYWYIPIVVLLFPSIPEEFFFRGLMIPRSVAERPWKSWAFQCVVNSTIFTLSRPLYALTVDPDVNPFFLTPSFLLIVFLLGVTCSLGYIISRSVWVPVIIHWATALFWLLFLGGGSFALAR